MLPVRLRDALRDVACELVLVELALLPPEETFRLGLHDADHSFVAERFIALNVDARYRQPASLVHVERDLELAIARGRRVHLHGRERISLGLVERIDSGNRAGDLVWIDGAANEQIDAIANRVQRHTIGAGHLYIRQNWALLHRHRDDGFPARRHLARDTNVALELAGRVQVLDGTLKHVGAERHAGGNAGIATEHRL